MRCYSSGRGKRKKRNREKRLKKKEKRERERSFPGEIFKEVLTCVTRKPYFINRCIYININIVIDIDIDVNGCSFQYYYEIIQLENINYQRER